MKRYDSKFKKIKENDSNVSYKASVLVEMSEDDYERGYIGRSSIFKDFTLKNRDLEKLLEMVADEVYAPSHKDLEYQGNVNDYNFGTELWYSYIGDENGYPVTEKNPKYKQWKNGEIVLYGVSAHIIVSRVGESPVSEDELKQAGIKV